MKIGNGFDQNFKKNKNRHSYRDKSHSQVVADACTFCDGVSRSSLISYSAGSTSKCIIWALCHSLPGMVKSTSSRLRVGPVECSQCILPIFNYLKIFKSFFKNLCNGLMLLLKGGRGRVHVGDGLGHVIDLVMFSLLIPRQHHFFFLIQ